MDIFHLTCQFTPMPTYLYLSLIPECLIASMLPPEEFGTYYAVGSQKRSRGQAIFFEVDPSFKSDYFRMEEVEKRCVPHDDGKPKSSTYLGVYRALEHVPISALRKLYVVTDDGRTLGLSASSYTPDPEKRCHLYQELCPVMPRIVSKLEPQQFCQQITDPQNLVNVPRIVFAELKLGKLSTDPETSEVDNLPYPNIHHLRDCLKELRNEYSKPNKTVIRHMQPDVLYRTVRGGFYIGDTKNFAHYPMPSIEELETTYYAWWRSALATFSN